MYHALYGAKIWTFSQYQAKTTKKVVDLIFINQKRLYFGCKSTKIMRVYRSRFRLMVVSLKPNF